MQPIEVSIGNSPLVLAMPHSGTYVPPAIWDKLNDRGRALADTDWHIPRLYAGLIDDVSIVKANFHRYVIDANRPPDGKSLYPGQNTTGLCPLIDFEGQNIYQDGMEPSTESIQSRLQAYHRPYHSALETALIRSIERHGYAILYDCHSIRSEVDFLFDSKLPDLNIGTFSGKSCAPILEDAVVNACASQTDYSHVLNGRFKGGWTTRHYGQTAANIHAVQMELCQSTYMLEAPPWEYRQDLAKNLRPVLSDVLKSLSAFRLSGCKSAI